MTDNNNPTRSATVTLAQTIVPVLARAGTGGPDDPLMSPIHDGVEREALIDAVDTYASMLARGINEDVIWDVLADNGADATTISAAKTVLDHALHKAWRRNAGR